jgi:hypothetical protein
VVSVWRTCDRELHDPGREDAFLPDRQFGVFQRGAGRIRNARLVPWRYTTERQACAKAWVDRITDIAVEIDNKPIDNLAPLRTRSGDFSFTVPNNNILGVPGPIWGFSSADGYMSC